MDGYEGADAIERAWRDGLKPEGRPHEAKYACRHCGSLIGERHKTWMLEQGAGRRSNQRRLRSAWM